MNSPIIIPSHGRFAALQLLEDGSVLKHPIIAWKLDETTNIYGKRSKRDYLALPVSTAGMHFTVFQDVETGKVHIVDGGRGWETLQDWVNYEKRLWLPSSSC